MKEENRNKIILDLCGGTGAWSKPYRDNGYDVRLITLPDYDVREYEPPDEVYGILAAPPCTMFSNARNYAKKPRNLEEGMEIVEACLKIIWKCRFKNKLSFWALENPIGYLKQFLGIPCYRFEPYDFGDFWSKRTCLWGLFNFPKKINHHGCLPIIDKNKIMNIGGNPKIKRELRSITPPGFAKAFFKANK